MEFQTCSSASWLGVKLGKRHAYRICLVLAGISFASARYWTGSSWRFTLVFCIACMFGMVAGSMNTTLFSDAGIFYFGCRLEDSDILRMQREIANRKASEIGFSRDSWNL